MKVWFSVFILVPLLKEVSSADPLTHTLTLLGKLPVEGTSEYANAIIRIEKTALSADSAEHILTRSLENARLIEGTDIVGDDSSFTNVSTNEVCDSTHGFLDGLRVLRIALMSRSTLFILLQKYIYGRYADPEFPFLVSVSLTRSIVLQARSGHRA